MLPFRRLTVEGRDSKAMRGDRFVYDQTSGTLFIHRDDGEVLFVPDDGTPPTHRIFIGRDFTRDLARASAELYAQLGGLSGEVAWIEGSYPTLHVFEVCD